LPQFSDRIVRPFEFGVRAAHQRLLLLLFHRNPEPRPAGSAPGRCARALGSYAAHMPTGTFVAVVRGDWRRRAMETRRNLRR
jgi:hypothetical protein